MTSRCVVDDLLCPRGVGERPQHVARAQIRESGVFPVGQFGDRNVGEYRFCFLAPAEPRQRVRAEELGFWSGAGAHGCFGEPVGEGQIREPDRAVGGFAEQVRDRAGGRSRRSMWRGA